MKYYHLQMPHYGEGGEFSSPGGLQKQIIPSSMNGATPYPPQLMPDQPGTPPRHFSPWACDYCRAATFRSFEEASAHEQLCPYNQNRIASPNAAAVPGTSQQGDGKRILLLAMPKDRDSLSDRQCYVRSNFVEVFTATEHDVQARHSKGAQKLYAGQVGIRCVFCIHSHPKDRAERAMCYPSSISRIYQTVADMQRFHFETCSAIPEGMKSMYKTLKTTRPRGMGSPQAYWISSAHELGLTDTSEGIRYDPRHKKEQNYQHAYSGATSPTYSTSTYDTSSRGMSPVQPPPLPATAQQDSDAPLHPEANHVSPGNPPTSPVSQHTEQRDQVSSPSQQSHGDDEAIMLLSLRQMDTKTPQYRPSGH